MRQALRHSPSARIPYRTTLVLAAVDCGPGQLVASSYNVHWFRSSVRRVHVSRDCGDTIQYCWYNHFVSVAQQLCIQRFG